MTDPQQYYVWDGTDLTLSCNYTNDFDNGLDNSLIIARDSSRNVSLRTNLVTYTLFADASVTIYPVACSSNWADACPADQLRDEYFNYGDDDDEFAGSLVVTQHAYDEGVETGEFECRLNLFTQSSFEAVSFVGNFHLRTTDMNQMDM